ncbi:MAG: TlpA disulfide reductase family protein [Acidobacteriota bacterium]|nr:TlpA disulfide reductase family protein [Acidobacteriota bacterium]
MTSCRRIILFLVVLAAVSCSPHDDDIVGRWRAWLDSPGGELPFGLEIIRTEDRLEALIINGFERILVEDVVFDGGELVISFPHYDSEIRARLDYSLFGEWSKRTGAGWSKLPFNAELDAPTVRFSPSVTLHGDPDAITGRWAVDFSEDDNPAVAIFESPSPGTVHGTFLTTTGDYRYLAGDWDGERLRLSCFDGAHAFLFDATLGASGDLTGDFWSRDTWHETWTARLDPEAELPDGFELTRWTGEVSLDDLAFPDIDGNLRSLSDPDLHGKVTILEIFGTWCPNCNDASKTMVGLHRRYRGRGLAIVGLAFEVTGDHERDAAQVRLYAERHRVDYPLLLAGLSDKSQASTAFPAIDRVRAYPTFVFLDATGEVRAVYSGFSGPATGEAHRRLVKSFETLIDRLFSE